MEYENVRKLREEKQFSQVKIGFVLYMSQSAYSRYETGRRSFSADALARLADFYGTSVDYLMGRTNEEKPYPKCKKKSQ